MIDDEKRAPYNYMKPNIKMASNPTLPLAVDTISRSTVTKHYYFPIKVFSELKSVMCARKKGTEKGVLIIECI